MTSPCHVGQRVRSGNGLAWRSAFGNLCYKSGSGRVKFSCVWWNVRLGGLFWRIFFDTLCIRTVWRQCVAFCVVSCWLHWKTSCCIHRTRTFCDELDRVGDYYSLPGNRKEKLQITYFHFECNSWKFETTIEEQIVKLLDYQWRF